MYLYNRIFCGLLKQCIRNISFGQERYIANWKKNQVTKQYVLQYSSFIGEYNGIKPTILKVIFQISLKVLIPEVSFCLPEIFVHGIK